MSSCLARRISAGWNHPLGDWLPLFTSGREGVFSETELPVYGVLGNSQASPQAAPWLALAL
jgi:hypothetical protein